MYSRNSSLSSTLSKPSTKAFFASDAGIDDYRDTVLEPNNIVLDEVMMTKDEWFSLAFSMGIPAQHGQRLSREAQKLAQRMKKRKALSATQTFDYLEPFLKSIVADCPGVSRQSQCKYHNDAVPTHDVLKNTIHRLPTPKPTLSLGYSSNLFSDHHIELQDGIINGPGDTPYNLNHISQPMIDHFWPFFAVQVSDKSLLAAQQDNAITAATCANSLNILAAATITSKESPRSTPSEVDERLTRSFSLAVHGKEACLSFHGAQGSMPFVATPILTYSLDNADHLARLADRIYNIIIWAQHDRLADISVMLNVLDSKVYGQPAERTLSSSDDDEQQLQYFSSLAFKSSSKPAGAARFKVALKAGLPFWLRE